jgi:predicted transcriptional regulator
MTTISPTSMCHFTTQYVFDCVRHPVLTDNTLAVSSISTGHNTVEIIFRDDLDCGVVSQLTKLRNQRKRLDIVIEYLNPSTNQVVRTHTLVNASVKDLTFSSLSRATLDVGTIEVEFAFQTSVITLTNEG